MTLEEKALAEACKANPEDRTTQLVFADWLDENGHHNEAAWHRAGASLTSDEFHASIIAQDDDGDYSESGYVACVIDRGGVRFGLLANYSHCSCYGTWESLAPAYGGLQYFRWTWVGPVEELVAMAKRYADPVLPDRVINDQDYDADHLMRVYEQVVAWAAGEAQKAPTMGCARPSGRVCDCVACIPVAT